MHIRLSHIWLLFVLVLSWPGYPFRFIVISEIQKDPVGGASECPGDKCHEFVEIANLGTDTLGTDSLFLTSGNYTDSVLPISNPMPEHPDCIYGRPFIAPGEIALILDREYGMAPTTPIAAGTVLLTVNRTSIAGSLTRTKGLLLYKGTRNEIIDSLAAAIDSGLGADARTLTLTLQYRVREGFSLVPEKILFGPPSYRPNPDSLSPGTLGTGIPENGWIVEYRLDTPSPAFTGIPCSTAVLRPGREISPGTTWSIIRTRTNETVSSGSVAQGSGIRYIHTNLPKDTAEYRFTVSGPESAASITFDMSTVWLEGSPLRISEIFPRATSDIPEWIELVNISSLSVNIKNWRFGTPEGSAAISHEDLNLQPGSYHVITRNIALFRKAFPSIHTVSQTPSWQALDNYNDTVFLFNPFDSVAAETVCYSSSWFDLWNRQSLERVNLSENATTAQAWVLSGQLSPGMPNSAAIWRNTESAQMDIGPVPFTPNGDGRDDLLLVRMQLPANAVAGIRIFSFNGDVIFEFPQPISRTQYWNGKTKNGSHAQAGPFFVVAEIEQDGRKILIRKKGVLWR